MIPLPIDPYLDSIRDAVARVRAVVLVAPPGSGKTTRVPPALLAEGPVVLLQPRRAAARAIAERMAFERGWRLGGEVGYQVRFDRRLSEQTRLLVVTEGILTVRMQSDPLLSDFSTVVIDEFHERSIHADLAMALAKQAWRARDDLRIVIMSATLDAGAAAAYLDGCPTFEVPGRTFPLDISHAPGAAVERVATDLAREGRGDVLCFLPGAAEINRAVSTITQHLEGRDVEVLPLHGGLSADAQMRALAAADSSRRRVVVATNIAETSVTVTGVTTVVDAGLQKVARYDPARGIDSLVLERITQDAADQRAGRAGRVAPGVAVRLWDPRDRLRAHREPDVRRIDLASVVLDVFAWGGHPSTFEWFEPPRQEALSAAMQLLERLGALHGGVLTPLGRRMHQIPVHPRLARMLVAADGAWPVIQMCALLSERMYLPPRLEATSSDVLPALDRWSLVPSHVKKSAEAIARLVGVPPTDGGKPLSEVDLRRILLDGYPDRVGRRRAPGSPRVKLASGTGAIVDRDSGVIEGEYLVALDVRGAVDDGSRRGGRDASENVVRIASRVEAEWLTPTSRETRHWFDPSTGQVRAAIADRYDALVLRETAHPIDPAAAAAMLTRAWLERGPTLDDQRLLSRLKFAGIPVDLERFVESAAAGWSALADVRLSAALDPAQRQALELHAPDLLRIPTGRMVPLEYGEDGSVSVSVKLQELFGLQETPRIGPRREPVLVALLAPNGRPVQVTRDLASFWSRTYPDVRRELRGRYPRHPWPEDPLHEAPTARARPRGQSVQTKPPGKKTR